MAAADCIARIRAVADDITDDEIETLVEELQNRVRARQAESDLLSLDDAILTETDALAADIEAAAQIERRNQLRNIKIKYELTKFIDRVAEETGDPALAIRARNVGVNRIFPGSRLSVDARGKALQNEYLGGFLADLESENLLPHLNSGTLDREIARELAEITKPDGKVGLTGSREAKRIAEIVDKYRSAALARENRAGAWIKPIPGYIVRQTHDLVRLRRAGRETWKDFVRPLLDAEKTFNGANPNEFLDSVYEGLTSGVHLKAAGGAENDLVFAFKGPGNLARRISTHRKLHFRDADAWMDYNEAFGRRSLTEAVVGDLQRSARNTAIMEAWGTNPRAMFDTVLREAQEKYRGDIKAVDKLRGFTLERQFREIKGSTHIAYDPSLAQVAGTIRATQSMAKLGGATLSAISDIAFQASEMRFQGHSALDSWGRVLSARLDTLPNRDRRIAADLIGVGLDGQLGNVLARFAATDHLPGRMAKLQQRFFKLNLLSWWTDSNDQAIGLMMARDMAMKKVPWGGLDDITRRNLELYGFDAAKWDIARKAVRDLDGREYLMPDALRELSDEEIGLSGRKARQMRDEIETALRSYYVDRVDSAIPKPGAREQSLLNMGTQPGTAVGEAIRFIMQFKAFPITAITRIIGRTAQADSVSDFYRAMRTGRADMLGLAQMIAGSTIMGYLAQSAKELAKGRSPRDPGKWETWNAAFLQGGGAGIYGDFLFGEFNRFGRTPLETAVGPTGGTIADALELWAKFRSGDDTAASAIRFATSNTPFINLFYTRAALDYLILYNLQEAANPGYLRRMERRVREENGQRFFLPPAVAVR